MGISVQSAPAAGPLAGSGNFHLWQAVSGQLQISFPTTVLESIRFEVSRAGNGVGRVGIGGVLIGQRSGSSCSVSEWLPIECDHSRGPSFLLSRNDESKLSTLREYLASQAQHHSRQVIGWFVSHPREKLELTREEQELHQRRFPGTLALIAKPDQFGALDIAVHEGAAMRAMEPVLSVAPLPIVRREAGKRRRLEPVNSLSKVAAPVARPVERVVQPRRTSWRTPVLVATAVLGAVLVSAMAAHTFRAQAPISILPTDSPIEMVSLHAMHRPGRLVVSWNGAAAPIRYASRVTLVLRNGTKTTRRVLTRAEALSGIQFFRQTSPEISASLVLETPDGATFTEETEVATGRQAEPPATRVTPDMLPPADGRTKRY